MPKLNLIVLTAILTLSSAVQAASIRENFLSLRNIFNPQGRKVEEATVKTRSSEPRAMVLEYLAHRYKGERLNYRYFWSNDRLMVNDQSGGTIQAKYVQGVVNEWVRQKHHWDPLYAPTAKNVSAIVDDLLKSGAAIGFDGGDVNGCSHVTPLLLILDRRAQYVYAVELSNCKP
ncbi:MAG: hypothetical protein ABL958_10745 [Bdellovibrionia bacterium]